jgi:hypothetical protein
MKFP